MDLVRHIHSRKITELYVLSHALYITPCPFLPLAEIAV